MAYYHAIGADPDSRDEKGRTRLQRKAVLIPKSLLDPDAIHETAVNFLLEHSAPVTATGHGGEALLHDAAAGGTSAFYASY